jgi:hypothetical protein
LCVWGGDGGRGRGREWRGIEGGEGREHGELRGLFHRLQKKTGPLDLLGDGEGRGIGVDGRGGGGSLE